MPDVRAAGVIVFVEEGKRILFLLLRSAKTGEWGPPKGKMETGESEIETAVRETYEECGLRRLTFVPGFRESVTYMISKNGKNKSKEAVYFLGNCGTDDVELSDEHTEAHLGTLDEVEQLVPHENLKAVFRKAAEFLKPKKN